jgi:hypothetical protein
LTFLTGGLTFFLFSFYLAAEIMTKFSARFDAKAAKDAKGKAKVNPLSTHSQDVAGAAAGSNAGGGIKAASATQDPPTAGRVPAVLVVKKRGETRPTKRTRITQGKNYFFLLRLLICMLSSSRGFYFVLVDCLRAAESVPVGDESPMPLIPLVSHQPQVWEGFQHPSIQFRHGDFFQ